MSQDTIQIAKSISTEFATALKSQVSQLRDEFNSNLSLTAESVTSIRRIVDEFESKWLAVDSQIGHQKTLMEAQKSIFDVEIKSLKGLIQDVLSKSVNQIVDDLKSEFGEKLRVNEGLHDEFTKKLSDNERANIDRVKTVIDSFEKKWANMDGAIADHADRFAKELTNIRKSIAESFNVDTVMNRILDEHGHLLKGAKGDEGEPGKSPSPTEVAKHILRDKTFAEMVKPEPVDPVVVADTLIKRHGDELKGDPGKDADPVDVVEVVGELMLKHGEAIRGKPGRDADERLVAEKLVSDQKFIGLVKEVIHSEPWSVGVYREGSVVKHFTGREYIAMQDTTEEPGDSTHWKRIGTHGLRDTGGFKDKHDYEPGDFYHKDGSTFFYDGVNHRLFAAKPFTKVEFDKEFKKIQDTVLKYHELHADSQKSIGLIEDVLVQNKAVIEDQGQRIQSLEKDVVDLLLQPTEINDGSVPLRAYKGQYVEGNDYTRGDVVTSYGVAYVKQSEGNGGLGDKSTWAKMTGGVSRSGGGGVISGSDVQLRNIMIAENILDKEFVSEISKTQLTGGTVTADDATQSLYLECASGGRGYLSLFSTAKTFTAGHIYAVSFKVTDLVLPTSTNSPFLATTGTVPTLDFGDLSIGTTDMTGDGTYCVIFQPTTSQTIAWRLGFGTNAVTSGAVTASCTLSEIQCVDLSEISLPVPPPACDGLQSAPILYEYEASMVGTATKGMVVETKRNRIKGDKFSIAIFGDSWVNDTIDYPQRLRLLANPKIAVYAQRQTVAGATVAGTRPNSYLSNFNSKIQRLIDTNQMPAFVLIQSSINTVIGSTLANQDDRITTDLLAIENAVKFAISKGLKPILTSVQPGKSGLTGWITDGQYLAYQKIDMAIRALSASYDCSFYDFKKSIGDAADPYVIATAFSDGTTNYHVNQTGADMIAVDLQKIIIQS